MLNWGMLKHPINYVVVTLMVLIAGIVFHYWLSYQTGTNPANALKST